MPTAGILKQLGFQQIQKDKTLAREEYLALLGVQLIFCFQVNCYSLNSVGPTMENLSGPRRFLVVYFTSALSNRGLIRDAKEDLQHMAQVIFPNT
ncbi:hypothetical protein Goari_018536, partial [Gossypium aridum]|nr:hypothetical protein [Gossypium aridum]